MALANPVSGQTIQATDVSAVYGLFKGVAGSEDTVTLKNAVDNWWGWIASSDPAAPATTVVLYIKDAAGNTKWRQYYDGNQYTRTDTPAFRMKGTETYGVDMRLVETAGYWRIQQNVGSEGTPSWADRVVVDLTTGDLAAGNITAGTYNGITIQDTGMPGLVAAIFFGGL